MLAPSVFGKRQKPYLLEGGGPANCAKGIQNANFSNNQKKTDYPAPEEKQAEQEPPLHYSH